MSRRYTRGPNSINPNAPRHHSTGMPWPSDPGPVRNDDPEPIPHWMDVPKQVQFTGAPFPAAYQNPGLGPLTGVANRAIWQSPVFDLRPDLGGNYRPVATRIPGAARMHLQCYTSDGTFLTALPSELEVYSVEAGHLANPQEIKFIEERFDISTDFYQGTESTVLEWSPPGAPMRFWRVSVIFDWYDALNPPPRLTCWASAH